MTLSSLYNSSPQYLMFQILHKGKHPILPVTFSVLISVLLNDNNYIKKIILTTSNIKNSVFLAKDTKRSEKDTVDTSKDTVAPPKPFSGANC